MFGPQVRTLDYIVNRVRTRFGRTTPELEEQLILDITDELRGVCAEFPYWFLRFDPGMDAVAGFPYANAAALAAADILEPWLDSGWFYTTDSVENYAVFSPLLGITNEHLWGQAELAQVNWAKVYSLEGKFLSDLKVVNGDVMWSRQNYAETGTPTRLFPFTKGHQTYLRLSPIPDQEYVIAVSGQFAYPPWFRVGNSYTNVILAYYPRVLFHIGMMYYAEYFQEVNIREFHRNILYGDAGGRTHSAVANIGLIGQMRIDTRNRETQETPDVAYGESVKDLLGRDGRAHLRRPGSGFYSDWSYE